MVTVDEEILRKIFSFVDTFQTPNLLKHIDFSVLDYYAWIDLQHNVVYMVYTHFGKLEGIRWRLINIGLRRYSQCEICNKFRKPNEIISVSAQTRTLPKGITYRSRSFHICLDFMKCNEDLGTNHGLQRIYNQILE